MHTVNQMFDRYESDEVPSLAGPTRANYRRHIAKLRHQFGPRTLKELSRSELVAYVAVNKGPIQRNSALSVLSSAITKAVTWGWVDSNICRGVPRNKSKGTAREITLQEFEEVKRIAPLRVRLMMDLARLTIQDQGILISMRWSHVNEERNVILCRARMTKRKIEVPITAELRVILDQCKKIRNGDYVVSRTMGDRYSSAGFRALWQRTMIEWETTGNDRFTFHDIKRWAKALHKSDGPSDADGDDIQEYPQFDEVTRSEAASMSRHYKVFYCLEQSIRKLITATMEKAYGTDWWNSGKINQQIKQEVDFLVGKEIDSGMEQRSERMIDYTTFGQLSQIITQNWDVFDKVFTSPKAVGKVMAGLNLLRGPIAHCCPMPDHEAERLAFAVKDWFNIRL